MHFGRKQMMNNRLGRSLIFGGLVILMCLYLMGVFSIANSDLNRRIFNAFYAEKKNTVDVVYFGTSATNRYFIGPLAYKDTGIAAFNLATMGMPMFFIPILTEEVEKTQDPLMYIIEMRWILHDNDEVTDAHIRRVTDSMKYSQTRSKAIEKALLETEGSDSKSGNMDDDVNSYYIPVLKYHNRLVTGDLRIKDILLFNSKNKNKGYVTSPKTLEQQPQGEPEFTEKRDEISDDAAAALDEVLNMCDEMDQEFLFVLSPYSVEKDEMSKFNTAMDIVRERGYDVVNFNTKTMWDELELNVETDFYNRKHVNYMGAEKYTKWLEKYLSHNFNLPDRRGEKEYESWNKAYDHYREYVEAGIQNEDDS